MALEATAQPPQEDWLLEPAWASRSGNPAAPTASPFVFGLAVLGECQTAPGSPGPKARLLCHTSFALRPTVMAPLPASLSLPRLPRGFGEGQGWGTAASGLGMSAPSFGCCLWETVVTPVVPKSCGGWSLGHPRVPETTPASPLRTGPHSQGCGDDGVRYSWEGGSFETRQALGSQTM